MHKLTKELNEAVQKNLVPSIPICSVKLPQCSSAHIAAFGALNYEKSEVNNPKWYVTVVLSGLLDDPSVLIEGVLFRARYLGSTQLVCEGQPTKSTRMCQAEEAVSRIKVYMRK